MKPSFILNKKHIILASLVLILGTAVYLNWTFSNQSGDLDLTTELTGENETEETAANDETDFDEELLFDSEDGENPALMSKGETEAEETNGEAETEKHLGDAETEKHLGDAEFVNAKSIADENYFAMAKLARDKGRDLSIQTIGAILDDENLTEADKKEATQKAMTLTDIIEAETAIENLVKAKGFSECMVYLGEETASVVVKTDGLDEQTATQIKNIVVTETNIKGENVSITEIK